MLSELFTLIVPIMHFPRSFIYFHSCIERIKSSVRATGPLNVRLEESGKECTTFYTCFYLSDNSNLFKHKYHRICTQIRRLTDHYSTWILLLSALPEYLCIMSSEKYRNICSQGSLYHKNVCLSRCFGTFVYTEIEFCRCYKKAHFDWAGSIKIIAPVPLNKKTGAAFYWTKTVTYYYFSPSARMTSFG